ncbi:MAG: ABC transporter permease [Zavarzinella sp.]
MHQLAGKHKGIDRTGEMNYSLTTIWHERPRYLPGIVAVAFSAVLIAIQCGMLLGLFKITSLPVDRTRADVWIGSPEVLSVDLGRPIPTSHFSRVAGDPRVAEVETYFQSFASWIKPDGGSELCVLIGSCLDDGSMGSINELTPTLRDAITEENTIIIDQSERARLGVTGIGDYATINRVKVRIVGETNGLKSLAGPYVFCSRPTAKNLLRGTTPSDHVTYMLIRCHDPKDAPAVAASLQESYKDRNDMSVFTSDQFSRRSRIHWLIKTKAGIALGYTAMLGLLVGSLITSQTLFAATMASAKEYAILLAMGIPRWRIMVTVVAQSFIVGLFGIALGYPCVQLLAYAGDLLDVQIPLPWELLALCGGLTLLMAVVSGVLALRSVRRIEPMSLLR